MAGWPATNTIRAYDSTVKSLTYGASTNINYNYYYYSADVWRCLLSFVHRAKPIGGVLSIWWIIQQLPCCGLPILYSILPPVWAQHLINGRCVRVSAAGKLSTHETSIHCFFTGLFSVRVFNQQTVFRIGHRERSASHDIFTGSTRPPRSTSRWVISLYALTCKLAACVVVARLPTAPMAYWLWNEISWWTPRKR